MPAPPLSKYLCLISIANAIGHAQPIPFATCHTRALAIYFYALASSPPNALAPSPLSNPTVGMVYKNLDA